MDKLFLWWSVISILGTAVIYGGFVKADVAEEVDRELSYIDEQYQDYAATIAEEYEIDPFLVVAMIEAESSGRRKVVSKAGCIGLMQINPKWHKDRMERLEVTDLKDAYSNILVGCDYLAELFRKHEDVYTVLMCYNQGEYGGAVEQAERGDYSNYARKIVNRAKELKGEEKWEENETLKELQTIMGMKHRADS